MYEFFHGAILQSLEFFKHLLSYLIFYNSMQGQSQDLRLGGRLCCWLRAATLASGSIA